jgi:H+/Cl- antiporter ClcA
MLSPSQIKDIIIGVLVAYVVIDLLLMYATKSRHPGLFGALSDSMKDDGVMMVVAIGIGLGFLAYYLARKSRDMFTTKRDE